MSRREVIDRLKDVPLFGSCSGRQLRHIASRGWEQEPPAGRVLCAEGKPGDDFFVILEGRADVRRKGRRIRGLGPGDYFGELALFQTAGNRALRTATVTAETSLRTFVLGRNDFRSLVYEEGIATSLLFGMAERVQELWKAGAS